MLKRILRGFEKGRGDFFGYRGNESKFSGIK